MSKYCYHCGTKLDDGDMYCKYCQVRQNVTEDPNTWKNGRTVEIDKNSKICITLGILGVLFASTIVGVILGVIGVVLSKKEEENCGELDKIAQAGMVLCWIAIVIGGLLFLITLI